MTVRCLFAGMVLILGTLASLASLPVSTDSAVAHGGCQYPEPEPAQAVATAAATPLIDPASETPANLVQTLRAQEAAVNIATCWTNDEEGFQQLATAAFLQHMTGESDPDEQLRMLYRLEPIWVTPIGPVTIDRAGRYGVTVLMQDGPNTQDNRRVIRWYLVDNNGALRLDQMTGATVPEVALPDAVIVEIEIGDGAFQLSREALPAEQTVIFRVRNVSESGTRYGFYLGRLLPGVGLAEIVASEPGIIDYRYFDWGLPADGTWNDFMVERFSPGMLVVLCMDADEGSDTYHYQTGLAALVTVE